ncbi:MAG: DHH family phosphoesterase [Erysipelotrichaceae bacterium]|nr:DHH family phosphoesterase [Erysipelotrichaceae bacterium]
MENNTKKYLLPVLLALVACLAVYLAYNSGKTSADARLAAQQEVIEELNVEQELLHELNRASVEKLDVEEGATIYVVGHMNPDTDTVCSAIAYARLLNMLGYKAEARVSGQLNKETTLVLQEIGVECPEELVDASGENIFLVDHSEYAQAVPGMEEAHIVGVLDHHGIGNVSTGNLVVYEARPIGATATIVWLDYLNYGLELDQNTAKVLLSAVLSDTNNLTGSTTTQADRIARDKLQETAQFADIDELYRKMREQALSYEGMTDEEILFLDYKEYESGGVKYGIGLVNSIDEDASRNLAERMKKAMEEYFSTRDVDLMYASVGIREGDIKIDYIVPADERSEVTFRNAFPNFSEFDGTSYIFRDGGLGRKTKFVPVFNDYLAAHPQDQ